MTLSKNNSHTRLIVQVGAASITKYSRVATLEAALNTYYSAQQNGTIGKVVTDLNGCAMLCAKRQGCQQNK